MCRVWTTKRNRSLSKAKSHHSDFGRYVISSIGAAALGIATTMPAFAGGSNTATTAATPATPAGVVTSTPQLSSVGAGGCAWQYTKAINNLGQQAITANDVGLAANAVGAAAAVTGLIASEVASASRTVEFGVMAGGLEAAAAGDPFLLAAPGRNCRRRCNGAHRFFRGGGRSACCVDHWGRVHRDRRRLADRLAGFHPTAGRP